MFCLVVLGKSARLVRSKLGTHPASPRAHVHAEVASLAKIPRQARARAILRIFRPLADGSMSMAKPCLDCQAYLLAEGVLPANVYWTDWSGQWQRGF